METKCPTCSQPWPNASTLDRVRAHRGSRTMTEAAAEARVGRITYGRIEAGIRTDWPAWLAVLSVAGISVADAQAAYDIATPQTGKHQSSGADIVFEPPKTFAATNLAVQYETNPAPPLEPTPTVEIPVKLPPHRRTFSRPHGETCGDRWYFTKKAWEYQGYCSKYESHNPSAGHEYVTRPDIGPLQPPKEEEK